MSRKAYATVFFSVLSLSLLGLATSGGASPTEDVGAAGPTGPTTPPTPNMGLQLPTPGFTNGTLWATQLNQAFTTVDSHNHTPGFGVAVPSAGININADLDFQGNNAINMISTQYIPQPSTLSILDGVYSVNGDVYWNNGTGTPVQITAGSALAASSLGGISGLPSGTAGVEFNSGSGVYAFTQATNQAAPVDTGGVIVRSPTGTSNPAWTITSPLTSGTGYTLTLPTGTPGSTLPVSMSTSGALSTGAITSGQIVNNTITRNQVVALGSAASTNLTTGGCSGAFWTNVTTHVVQVVDGGSAPIAVTMTTSGGPVMVTLLGCGNHPSSIHTVGPITGGQALIQLSVDGGVTGVYQWDAMYNQPTVWMLPLTAGTHTIGLFAQAFNGGSTYVEYVSLLARELF